MRDIVNIEAWYGYGGMCIMVLAGCGPIRRRWYRLFKVSHHVGLILFLAGMNYHSSASPLCPFLLLRVAYPRLYFELSGGRVRPPLPPRRNLLHGRQLRLPLPHEPFSRRRAHACPRCQLCASPFPLILPSPWFRQSTEPFLDADHRLRSERQNRYVPVIHARRSCLRADRSTPSIRSSGWFPGQHVRIRVLSGGMGL